MKINSRVNVVRPVVLTWLGAFAAAFLLGLFFWDHLADFHKEVRGYLFSGFLTLGSFLLTTKTFVITRLQDGLFHTPEYDDLHKRAVAQVGESRIGPRNVGLSRLTEFLV